jgi:hypothetical protein
MDDKPTGGDLPRKWYEIHSEPELPNRSPSAAPVPKVIGSTAGAGLGGYIGAVMPWVVYQIFGVEMPTGVVLGFVGIFSTIGSFVGGYFTPPRSV